ncbi:MAG: alpha/beta fold hydrolase [Niastella sp.]|uniref:alpha/beta fold hydrolase n=1 Tax=Niastella sp. TaxID=1869183 RepID=UPI00389A54C6
MAFPSSYINQIEVSTEETTIFLQRLGSGPGLLLLHGFPQTHLMWREVAQALSNDFTVICADLRGYGQSGCPLSDKDHSPYSKRAMARDMVQVMEQLGFTEFMVAGHDRGGRVAYRLSLDHPKQVKALAVLDILPVAEVWNRADRHIIDFWPWSLLSQAAPFPERLISGAPDAIIDNAFSDWGTDGAFFSREVRAAYIQQLYDPLHVHAICEEFRAAATIDYLHDKEDQKQGNRIQCPVLALWSAGGPLDTWYAEAGGPLNIWRNWAHHVQGLALHGGHFFPEADPEGTVRALRQFFKSGG